MSKGVYVLKMPLSLKELERPFEAAPTRTRASTPTTKRRCLRQTSGRALANRWISAFKARVSWRLICDDRKKRPESSAFQSRDLKSLLAKSSALGSHLACSSL